MSRWDKVMSWLQQIMLILAYLGGVASPRPPVPPVVIGVPPVTPPVQGQPPTRPPETRPPETRPPEGKPPQDPEGKPPAKPKGPGRLDPMGARLKIKSGSSGCTATVIGPRRADGRWDMLTAAHCIGSRDGRVTATTPAGKVYEARIVVQNKAHDLAWGILDTTDDLDYALLAKTLPDAGTRIWHAGYGVDVPGNREEGVWEGTGRVEGMWYGRIKVSSGDSGSGFFHAETGEVVGVLYGTGGGKTIGGHCLSAWAIRPKGEG